MRCSERRRAVAVQAVRLMAAVAELGSLGQQRRRRTHDDMARRLIPSSFECDCGHQSHFCEGTVREMELNSRRRKRPMLLLDSEVVEHAVEFSNGQAIAIICPQLGHDPITGWA